MAEVAKRFVLELSLEEFGMLTSLSAIGMAGVSVVNADRKRPDKVQRAGDTLTSMMTETAFDFRRGTFTVAGWNALTDRMQAMAIAAGGEHALPAGGPQT